jgi:hypothetical protein
MTGTIVQSFFAYRIYICELIEGCPSLVIRLTILAIIVSERNLYILVPVAILIIGQLCSGIGE